MEITEEDMKNAFRAGIYPNAGKTFDDICRSIENRRYISKYGVGPNFGDRCALSDDERMQILKKLNSDKNVISFTETRYYYKRSE